MKLLLLYVISIILIASTTNCTSIKTLRKKIDYITDSLAIHKIEIFRDSNKIISNYNTLLLSKDSSEYIDTSEKVIIIFDNFDTSAFTPVVDISTNKGIALNNLYSSTKPRAIIIEKKKISLKKNITSNSHTNTNINQSLVKLKTSSEDNLHTKTTKTENIKDKKKTGINIIKILITIGISLIGIIVFIYLYKIRQSNTI